MKKFDIQPTEENLASSFVSDFLGRDSYILSLVEILNALEGSFSIAIDGSWGSGKTFVVKQTKMLIDSLNPINPFSKSETGVEISKKWKQLNNSSEVPFQPMITTYYDAWEHDDEDDPILSIVYEMMQENYCIDKIPNKRNWGAILKNVAKLLGKKNLSSLIENINDVAETIQGEDLFSAQKNNDKLKEIIDDFFNTMLPEAGNKLIVFIDELDRCKPTYAVKLLERIKHYMQNDSVVFVFALNQVELEKTIRHFYGTDFDACRYLDRFFDYRIGLPEVDMKKYYARMGMSSNENLRQITCFEFVRQTGMSLRELPKLLIGSKIATYKITDSKESEKYNVMYFEKRNTTILAMHVIVPLAMGLKLLDSTSYQDFITGKNPMWLEKIILSDALYRRVLHLIFKERAGTNMNEDIINEQVREQIRKIYEAIFVKTYDNGVERETEIGPLSIDEGTRHMILSAVNYSSKYRDISVD